jgi:RNA polymerase sigma factor (sigma-70 family)
VKEETDNEIMYQVRAGQLDRLAVLYDRYQAPLFGFFRGMTQDRELSADLVQNVFYRILKYKHQFQGGQFRTWLFHIARNVHHDQYRRKNQPIKVSIDDYKDQIRDRYETDFELNSAEDLGLLRKAIAALPEDKREILLLSKYQEKNYKEIGEILGCTEGAVKVRVFRALNDLKAMYYKVEGIKIENTKFN